MSESGVSETTIFNAALTYLGVPKRVLTADEPSEAATACRERYPNLRDTLIRGYRWNFSTRRVEIAEDATPPVFGYAHRYKTPAGCLKVWMVKDQRDNPWSLEAGYIVTDLPAPIYALISVKVQNPQEFDPVFVEVLSMDLAIALAPKIGGKRANKLDLAQARREAIEEAKFADAGEGEEEEPDEGDWLAARRQ
jgi:hypothetical protein